MKNRKIRAIAALLPLLLLVGVSQAQIPDTTWFWRSAGVRTQAYSVLPTVDGSSLLGGYRQEGSRRFWLQQVDAAGNPGIALMDTVDAFSQTSDVALASNGDIIHLLQATYSENQEVVLNRVSPVSGEVWSTRFSHPQYDYAEQLHLLSDGSSLLTFRTQGDNFQYILHVAYVSNTGAVLLDTVYANAASASFESGIGIYDLGEAFLVLSQRKSTDDIFSIHTRTILPDGTLLNESDTQFQGLSTQATKSGRKPNGNLVVAGTLDEVASFVAEMTVAGELVWTTVLPSYMQMNGIVGLDDGSVILCGRDSAGNFVLKRYDPEGNPAGERIYEFIPSNSGWFDGIEMAHDGGLFVIGHSFFNEGVLSAFLMRFQAPAPLTGNEIAVQIEGTVGPDTSTILATATDVRLELNPDAMDGYDPALDIPLPFVPPSTYLALSFPHPEWDVNVGPQFMVDARSDEDLSTSSKTWPLNVVTDQVGMDVSLQFDFQSMPEDYGVYLYDAGEGSYSDVRLENTYVFEPMQETSHFELYVGGQAPPPLASFDAPALPNVVFSAGQEQTLEWTAVAPAGISEITVEYTTDDGATWQQIAMFDQDTSSCTWVVPDLYSIYTRIRVTVEDQAGRTVVAFGPQCTIAPSIASVDAGIGWSMLSLPLNPAGSSVENLFGDDLGGVAWFYIYASQGGYSTTSELDFPIGFWLANMEAAATLTIDGSTVDGSMTQPLLQGWNQLGNGLPAATPVDSLIITDGSNLSLHFDDAVDAGLISPAVYGFNPVEGVYELADTLHEWMGYWLHVLEPDLQLETYQVPWWEEPPSPGLQVESNLTQQWSVPIVLQQGERTSSPAYFGVAEHAGDGFDLACDFPAPPLAPSGEVLRVIAHHPEWQSPVGALFQQDLHAPLENGESTAWRFIVQASEPGDLTISFSEVATLLPESISLVMQVGSEEVDLRAQPFLTIAGGEDTEILIIATSTTLSVGESDDLPIAFGIESAYPNPFNSSVRLNVSLPQAGRLEVGVYNVLGQHVATLTNRRYEAGRHHVTWNATGYPTGLYLVRATSEHGATAVRKVLFVK